jgi:adenylate kinase family enzyme
MPDTDLTTAPASSARRERIVVIGTTGSGKTTLAKYLARLLDARMVELDALFHEANWTPAELPVFRARIAEAIDTPRWVSAGNYRSLVQDILWRSADTIVWLDYPFPLVMWRLFWRTTRRGVRNEELWNGNRESLRMQFFTSESLFNWARKSHWKHRNEWAARLAEPDLAHVRIIRLRSPKATNAWVQSLRAAVAHDANGETPQT